MDGLARETGKHIALLGSDYLVDGIGSAEQSLSLTTVLQEQWTAGGLVTLTWSVKNPWYNNNVGMYCHSAPVPCVPGRLAELVTTSTEVGKRYKSDLDSLSADLASLQAAGVVVLFRPFHEMNGNWFWWGVQDDRSPSREEFTSLWQYTYNYLTFQKNIRNLIWVFSPENSKSNFVVYPTWHGMVQPAPYYYPGDMYVDVVGIDLYTNQLNLEAERKEDRSEHLIPTYDDLIMLNKPFGFAELGPENPSLKIFDFDRFLQMSREFYPAVSFFVAWQDDPRAQKYYSIVNSASPRKLMNDPLVVTREDVASGRN